MRASVAAMHVLVFSMDLALRSASPVLADSPGWASSGGSNQCRRRGLSVFGIGVVGAPAGIASVDALGCRRVRNAFFRP